MTKKKIGYYLPAPSHWPLVGSIAIFCLLFGAALWLHGTFIGPYLSGTGLIILIVMLVGWFGTVIHESRAGLLQDAQVDRSFRLGMLWFIFTEVMFFAVFFAALFYARYYSVPFLGGGTGHSPMTHQLLWPDFKATWPLFKTPDPTQFKGPASIMYIWGIPAINTLILLSSGVTITITHWSLLKKKRVQMLTFQWITILLGVVFLMMQAHEYWTAYTIKALRMEAGIYGATFFMLTGFHALHVTVGLIALIVILWRMKKGDFDQKNHFAFEGVSWYWHFVDIVWLGLFIFVYWM